MLSTLDFPNSHKTIKSEELHFTYRLQRIGQQDSYNATSGTSESIYHRIWHRFTQLLPPPQASWIEKPSHKNKNKNSQSGWTPVAIHTSLQNEVKKWMQQWSAHVTSTHPFFNPQSGWTKSKWKSVNHHMLRINWQIKRKFWMKCCSGD